MSTSAEDRQGRSRWAILRHAEEVAGIVAITGWSEQRPPGRRSPIEALLVTGPVSALLREHG
jgi:hypothetical protein